MCDSFFLISLSRTSADGYASSGAVAGCLFRHETDALQAGPLAVVIVPGLESQQRFAQRKIKDVLSYVSRTSKP